MKLWIDHVILAVQDLDGAAARLSEEFGLRSVEGGQHREWGTANRIVPLGRDYIELLAVSDRDQAAQSWFWRQVLERVSRGDRLFGWCVGCDELEGLASMLDLPVTRGSRTRPDGVTLRWRSAGLERALEEPGAPFFVTWEIRGADHPGRMAVEHRGDPQGIEWIEVAGTERDLDRWIGPDVHWLPVRLGGPPPGIKAVGIATGRRDIVVR